MQIARAAFAAALSALAFSPALAEPQSLEIPLDPGGKFFTTLPQSNDRMQVSHALALACTGGAHHIAARLVFFVDKASLTAAFPDEAAQTKFLEQSRFRAQSALRVTSASRQQNLPVTYNAQLDLIGQEITQKSNVMLTMVATPQDMVPFAGPCPKLFEAPLAVSWPIIRALDMRNKRGPAVPMPPLKRPELAV